MWLFVSVAWAATVDVVVASHDLEAGVSVGGGDVRVVRGVPPASVPEGAIGVPTKAIGRVLVRRVLAGEMLREERFDPAYGTKVDARVPAGRHALFLPIQGTVGNRPVVAAGGCVVSRDAPVALWQTAEGAVSEERPDAAVGAWVAVTAAQLSSDLSLVDATSADCPVKTP